MSTKCPAIAAAAAIAGDTRWVRPLKPWRPSKLRFEVEAQRSSGASLSGFIARHIEQPGSRHSDPAVGAGADENAVELDVGDLGPGLQAHVLQRAMFREPFGLIRDLVRIGHH